MLLLSAIAERSGRAGSFIRYAPSHWLHQRPSPTRRKRWSRWTRRLADARLVVRLTEPNRDRVREVKLTRRGLRWVIEHCGPGAVLASEPLAWGELLDGIAS